MLACLLPSIPLLPLVVTFSSPPLFHSHPSLLILDARTSQHKEVAKGLLREISALRTAPTAAHVLHAPSVLVRPTPVGPAGAEGLARGRLLPTAAAPAAVTPVSAPMAFAGQSASWSPWARLRSHGLCRSVCVMVALGASPLPWPLPVSLRSGRPGCVSAPMAFAGQSASWSHVLMATSFAHAPTDASRVAGIRGARGLAADRRVAAAEEAGQEDEADMALD